MPTNLPRLEFTFDADGWQPWPGIATDVELLLASFPSTSVVAPAGNRSAGLTRGERALAAAATARVLGCRYLAAVEARQAADALKRRREVQVLLEEGLPSPLTGRAGAVITAAGGLARSPAILAQQDIRRLEDEKLDDQEIVDLILTTAVASWSARITLGLGRPTKD